MAPSRISTWLPVALWAAVIFAFSSVPSLSTGLGFWDIVLRKLAHLGEFAILGALLARALGRAWPGVVLGSLYAASDELHQTFVVGRVGAPLDWALDTVGVVAGVALFLRRRGRARDVAPREHGSETPGGADARAKI